MLPSKLLYTVSHLLAAADTAGPEVQFGSMVHELRLVQSDLRKALEELDAATDDEAQLAAMRHWNEAALWAEMLVTALCEKLNQPIPI